MKKIVISLILWLSVVGLYATELPIYNSGFEVWENVYLPIDNNYLDIASGWDVLADHFPIEFSKEDDYHSEGNKTLPRSGNYAMFFIDTSFPTPIRTKGYILGEGTYKFSIYASNMGFSDTYITLSATGDGYNVSKKYAINGNGYSKYTLSFTLEETKTIYLGINNVNDNHLTIFAADDCSLVTNDGTLVSTEYDYISTDNSSFVYYLYSSGDAELARCIDKNISGKITIPSIITKDGKDYKVRKISPSAFAECANINEIILPTYLFEIGTQAFKNCSSLSTVVVPNRVTTIASEAFVGCNNLSAVELFTKEVPSIASNAFPAKSDTYLYVPHVNDYNKIENVTIRSLGYSSSYIEYSGSTANIVYSYAPGVSAQSIDQSSLTPNVGLYYLPATFVHNSGISISGYIYIPIHKKTLKITTNNVEREYGNPNPQLSILYIGFADNEDENVLTKQPSISTTATQTSDVGEYPITISGARAKNYSFVYEPGTLTITKAPLTAKVNNTSRQYGTENPAFKISYTGLKNGETEPKWEEALNIVTPATIKSDVGIYDVTATGTPQNYDLNVENGILIITQAPLTIVANDATRQYFDDNPIFDYTCYGLLNNDDKRVLTSVPTLTTEATKTSNVGKYKINLSGATAKNYDILHKQGELTITKRSLTATSHCSRQYGEENPLLPIEYTGFVNNENENVLTTKPVGTTTATKTSAVGNYPITVSGGDATNYDFVYEQGVLTVTKASLSAKVRDVTKVYGEQNPNFSLEYNGLKNGETVPAWTTQPTFQTEATKASGVGQYAVKAVNGIAANYDLEIADGTLSITPADLTIQANNASRLYYEDDPVFGFSCLGFVNNDDVQVLTKAPTYVTDAIKTSNVGKYNITPSGAEAKNYAISYEPGELTITKRPLTVTSHCTRKYGEDNPLLPIEYEGFVNNEKEDVISVKPTASTTAKITSPVGHYPIILTGGEATNYDFTYEQGVLMVTKASLSAKVSDATKVYGSQNPTFSIEYFGLKNGETVPKWTTQPTFQTEAIKASGVGQYAVKAVNGVAVNYNLEIGDGILTVTPAALTIRANNASRMYYEENPTFSYKCNGFVNGDNESVLTTTPALTTSAIKTSNVGAYDINVGETSSPNYSISYVNGTLTINPRTLKASVGNYERIYNEDNPAFEVNYNGFVGNDDESVLREKAIASTTATKTSDVGTYTISVTGGSADNYTLSYTSGTLTINKAEQTIAWEQELKGLKVGDQVELKAVSSSGLPITYRMETNNYAEIYSVGTKYYLDCMADGEAQIVAVQEGNRNYYSSPRIRKSVYIGHATEIDAIDNLSVTISSTSFGIRVSNVNMGDVIKVYSADGVLHKSVRADAKTIDIPLTKGYMYIVKVGTKTMKLFY